MRTRPSACCLHGGHEEDGADGRSPAAHSAIADLLATLVGVRREAGESRRLLAIHGSKFRHGGQQGRGRGLTDALHCGDDVGPALQGRLCS